MDEQLLIEGCCKNERKAQEFLYRKYFPIIRAMCERYTRDEDQLISIVNNGFLKVFKGIHTFSGKGSFEGWIRRTSFHALSDYFRKENKYIKRTSFDLPDKGKNGDALNDLYLADLVELIELLPKVTCKIFKLYAIEGYTHKEIGAQLGMSDGTSKWHLFEARKKLKAMLKNRENKLKYAR